MNELQEKGYLAKEASYQLAIMTTEQKNKGLLAMADGLEQAMQEILAAMKRICSAPEKKASRRHFWTDFC